MEFQKLFPVSELHPGSRKVIQLPGRKVLIVNINDQIFAVDNSCPHMRFPLDQGRITEDCGIICPFHHSAFDLKTGNVKDWSPWPPGLGRMLGRISREHALPIFETKIEDGYLWVSKLPVRND
jgi:nitrite reductase/ring-hydroxylating ferredoxin subunit